MKKLTILTVLLLVSLAAWSQVDVASAMDTLDLSQVDMSGATVGLQGPVDLYITGVEYMGQSYAAILKYDGMGNFEVVAPTASEMATTKYDSLDVSNVEVVPPATLGGVVTLKGIIVNGYIASVDVKVDTSELAMGKIVFTAASEPVVTAMAETHPKSMEAAQMAAKEKNSQLMSYIAQVDSLESQLEDAQAEIADLQAKASMAMGSEMVSAEGASTLFVDLSTMQTFGKWTQTASGIDMTDPSAAYAKVGAAMSQTKNEIFYDFTVDGNSSQKWIGAGAHILASNVQAPGRYAFGKSYLVWLTKDARNQTDATFIQLYESINDGRMVQLASKAIDSDINSANEVSVYVNKTTDMIVISVNGVQAIAYHSTTDLPDGQIAALRAAGGPVSFSGLSVKAK